MEIFLQNPWIIFAILIWVLPWKGYALWKAGRLRHKWWFIALFITNTLAVLEILYIFVFSKKSRQKVDSRVDKINKARTRKKEENKDKILTVLQRKNKITNDEVQSLLGVSDATATRYLGELEKNGKIKQIGGSEKYTYYRLK